MQIAAVSTVEVIFFVKTREEDLWDWSDTTEVRASTYKLQIALLGGGI